MKHANLSRVVMTGVIAGTLLAGAVIAGAQTVPPPGSTPKSVLKSPTGTTAGAFDQLSPGNKKIVRAIFEAQKPSGSLKLDQIAGMKHGGSGWGEVYKDLQKRGLVTDKNLGQAVSAFEQRHGGDAKGNAVSASGRGRDGDDKGGSRPSGSENRGNPSGFSDGRGSGFGGDRGFSSGGFSGGGGGGGVGHSEGRGR